MKIAILDIGSNNIKLEIHNVENDGRNELLYLDKIPARLGHQVFTTQKLSEKSIELAIQGLQQFSKIVRQFQCKKTIALGTAALREAESENFIRRVNKECGIAIKIISGVEEARLVYLGALSSMPFKKRTFFLNDIGGGSTEVSVSDDKNIYFMESIRLGAVRLKELFEQNNVHDKKEADQRKSYEMIEHYIKKIFTSFAKELKKFPPDMGLCTGGTSRNLLEMIKSNYEESILEEEGIPILKTKHLRKLVREMKTLPLSELSQIRGLDKQRTDIIVPGAILLLFMLELLEIQNSFILNKGLRDGALADHIQKKVNKSIYLERQESSREWGLKKLSIKFNLERNHAEQCANLAIRLFDILENEHQLKEEYKDILYGGALLHDIGSYISFLDHHKHSEYLIMNSEIHGFSEKEKKWIALIARYHRKGFPKESHQEYQGLSFQEKEMILMLSAIVRIADSLDRSYRNAVKAIEPLGFKKNLIKLGISGKDDLSLELWSVQRKKEYFETVFKKQLEILKLD